MDQHQPEPAADGRRIVRSHGCEFLTPDPGEVLETWRSTPTDLIQAASGYVAKWVAEHPRPADPLRWIITESGVTQAGSLDDVLAAAGFAAVPDTVEVTYERAPAPDPP